MTEREINVDANRIITLTNPSKDVNVFTKLRRLRDRSEFLDVTLMSNDGYSCQVHACVVAAQSEFLHHLLAQSVQRRNAIRKESCESRTSSTSEKHLDTLKTQTTDGKTKQNITENGTHISLDQLSSDMLYSCVLFMYGEDLFVKYKELNDLANAAKILKLPCLETLCRDSILPETQTIVLEIDTNQEDVVNDVIGPCAESEIKLQNIHCTKRTSELESGNDELLPLLAKHESALLNPKHNTELSVLNPEILLYFDQDSSKFHLANHCIDKPQVELHPSLIDVLNQTFSDQQKSNTLLCAANSMKSRNIPNSDKAYLKTETVTNSRMQKNSRSTARFNMSPGNVEIEMKRGRLKVKQGSVTGQDAANTAKSLKSRPSADKNQVKTRVKTPSRSVLSEAQRQQKLEQDRANRIEYKTKEYICSECGLKCIGRYKFQAHVMIVHKRKYVCKYCNRAFFRRQMLESHVARHENRYLLMCDKCDYRGFCYGDLKYHIDTVHNPQVHQCSKCPSQYKSLTALRSHERTHEGPLKCDQCDYFAIDRFRLRNHKEEAHVYNIAECNICDKVFPSLRKARKHQLKVHPETVERGPRRKKKLLIPHDYRYGSVESNVCDARNYTFSINEDGNRLSSSRRMQENENSCSVSENVAEIKSTSLNTESKAVSSASSSEQATSALEGTDDGGLVCVDLKDMTVDESSECENFEQEFSSVIYVEAGTGRILSEEEVVNAQMQLVDSQEPERRTFDL